VPSRLDDLIAEWVADERPAWETIDALERDVEKVLRGLTTQKLGMPLRSRPYVRQASPAEAHAVRVAYTA
jgi:hypothetical protein